MRTTGLVRTAWKCVSLAMLLGTVSLMGGGGGPTKLQLRPKCRSRKMPNPRRFRAGALVRMTKSLSSTGSPRKGAWSFAVRNRFQIQAA